MLVLELSKKKGWAPTLSFFRSDWLLLSSLFFLFFTSGTSEHVFSFFPCWQTNQKENGTLLQLSIQKVIPSVSHFTLLSSHTTRSATNEKFCIFYKSSVRLSKRCVDCQQALQLTIVACFWTTASICGVHCDLWCWFFFVSSWWTLTERLHS